MTGATPRHTGVLVDWDDERGYGWVEQPGVARRVFLHVSAYPGGAARPMSGDEITFVVGAGPDGRRQAREVEVVRSERSARLAAEQGERHAARRRGRLSVLPFVLVPLFAVLFLVVVIGWQVPLWGIVLYPAMSVATYFLYLLDKRAALAGTWRVREATLLIAGLLGGWPGGAIAQQVLRHKTRKWDFQAAFWCLAVLNVAIFVLLVWYPDVVAAVLHISVRTGS